LPSAATYSAACPPREVIADGAVEIGLRGVVVDREIDRGAERLPDHVPRHLEGRRAVRKTLGAGEEAGAGAARFPHSADRQPRLRQRPRLAQRQVLARVVAVIAQRECIALILERLRVAREFHRRVQTFQYRHTASLVE